MTANMWGMGAVAINTVLTGCMVKSGKKKAHKLEKGT